VNRTPSGIYSADDYVLLHNGSGMLGIVKSIGPKPNDTEFWEFFIASVSCNALYISTMTGELQAHGSPTN
jgi:hypothetical protein